MSMSRVRMRFAESLCKSRRIDNSQKVYGNSRAHSLTPFNEGIFWALHFIWASLSFFFFLLGQWVLAVGLKL